MPEFITQHPIALTFASVFVGFVLLRTAYWRFAPRMRACETCGHQGDARRIVRGAYWIELPILVLGLTVGLLVHLLLSFAILTFLWRTFGAYLVCENCGSERLDRVHHEAHGA